MYIYIYIYMHTYIHIHIYAYTQLCTLNGQCFTSTRIPQTRPKSDHDPCPPVTRPLPWHTPPGASQDPNARSCTPQAKPCAPRNQARAAASLRPVDQAEDAPDGVCCNYMLFVVAVCGKLSNTSMRSSVSFSVPS
jgi:hypothetical protein